MAEGYHGPPPLRSEQWPLGFPWLNGIWAAKVESANTIYLEICSFCEFLATLNITWSIENPEWSYLWYIDAYKRLALGEFLWASIRVFMVVRERRRLGC